MFKNIYNKKRLKVQELISCISDNFWHDLRVKALKVVEQTSLSMNILLLLSQPTKMWPVFDGCTRPITTDLHASSESWTFFGSCIYYMELDAQFFFEFYDRTVY